jgi:uncharacterized protein (DUF2236 family)
MAPADETIVSEASLERALAGVRAAACGAVAGVFGPESQFWRVNREAVVFFGAGRALLLQLAHPWVAAAIAEHSNAAADPIGRFHRTFGVVYPMVFGSLEQALAASRRLHRRHDSITGAIPQAAGPFARGSRYCANDIAALRWVFATLIDTALWAHDLVLAPLGRAERERYYSESRLFAALFGLAAADLPADWQAFADYRAAMVRSEALTVSAAARDIGRRLLFGKVGLLPVPRWYRAVTAVMLPRQLRDGFGLPFDASERQRAARALDRIRALYPLIPARLRYVAPYHEAMARLSGNIRGDAPTRMLNRFWIGRPLMDKDA